jgi:hypothetical protein
MTLRKLLAGMLLGLGLTLVPVTAAIAETTINQENNSEDSEAQSGDANAGNFGGGQAGPEANGAGSSVEQDGDNEADVEQSSQSKSGAAVAGSQVTGVAGDGDVTINSRNNSKDDKATSGNAGAVNFGLVFAGPEASGAGSSIVQNGDNEILLDQDASAETGDAVSGSQVTGVVGF